MKKNLLFFILGIYLLFIVSIPLIYFFFYGPTETYRCSLAFDTKNNQFFLIGDSFVLEKVSFNDKDITWQRRDKVYRSSNLDFTKNKVYHLFIRDKQNNFIDFKFHFPKPSLLNKQLVDFSCKTSVVEPKMTINNEAIQFFEGNIDAEYVFSEQKGELISIKNIVIDFKYQTESAKISYSKFFSGLFSETVRYFGIAWHFFVEFNKYLYKVVIAFYDFAKEPVSWFASNTYDFVLDGVYRSDKSLFQGIKNIYGFVGRRLDNVNNHILAIFRNNYLFVFVNDIGGNSSNLVGTIQSNASDMFRGVNSFFHRTMVASKVEKQKRKEVVVQNTISSKIYTVATEIDGLEFSFANGLGEPISNERVKINFKSKVKNNERLLSPMTMYTNEKGEIKLNFKFGHKVSDYELRMNISGRKFVYIFKTEPDKPTIIKDLTKRPMLFQKAGKLVKRAFVLCVFDQYSNKVSGAEVELLEQDIDSQNEPFIFAEGKSDAKGNVVFDYRMNDNSGRVLIIAKIKDVESRFAYTVHSESTRPVELVAIDDEEVEAIIGIPLKAPFKVKVLDDNGNSCPHVPVDFSFQTSMFEEIESKKVRTDKNGIAEVLFRTPEVVGYFQVIASSPRVPDYEAAFVVLVMPGDAAKMIVITGDKQTVEWEKTSEPMVVQVLDDKENPIPNAEIKWNSQKNISFVDYDDTTDLDGFARAIVRVNETQSKENNIIVQVGKVKDAFKLYPRQPSFYKLDLLSKSVVNVFTNQMMAEPIEFVLRDQYGNVLPEEKVSVEYIVYKRGVQYLQNYNLVTDKNGIVSFNFVVSDQKDVINLKGKYYVEGKPRITWVKINVIPEEISNIIVPEYVEGVVASKLSKPIQIFVADNNASPVVDIFLLLRLKKAPIGANIGKEADQIYQLKTNRQGMCEFNPLLGNLQGEYVYTAQINTLQKDIVINAVPGMPTRIRIVSKENNKFPVFKDVNTLSVQFYDMHDNLITKGGIIYDINTEKKLLRHDFNKQATIEPTGLTPLPFKAPERKGTYFVYVTDLNYSTTAFYQFEAFESNIDSLIMLGVDDKNKDYIAGRTYKSIFKTRVVDRFGNSVEKTKLSMDLYLQGVVSSSIGADAFTDQNGTAVFDIVMPEKAGLYDLVVYSDEDETVRQTVQIRVKPEDIYSAIILSGNNQTVEPGLNFSEDFSIRLLDRYDNPIEGEQVRWSYSINVRGETRQYIQTELTDVNGIATFNYLSDSIPGVKEIKAYYRKDHRWDYVSYYVKVLGLSVDFLRAIAGNNQSALLGKEISELYVVKAFDLNGATVQDMPIVFQLISEEKENKGSVITEKVSRTDSSGIAKQKFVAPVFPGNYKIVAFPQFQDRLKVVFDLTVMSEVSKSSSNDELLSQSKLLRLIALQLDKIVSKIGDNSRLCEVVLVDRLNNPIPGVSVEWEIYDVIRNATHTRITKTDNEGKTWLPDVNRTYERKFVVKVTELNSKASLIFNVDIVKDLRDNEVSLNYLGLSSSFNNLGLSSDDLPNVFSTEEDSVIVLEKEIENKVHDDVEVFVGQTPYVFTVQNKRDRVIVGEVKVGQNRQKTGFVLEPNKAITINVIPNVEKKEENVKISVIRNRMIPWLKDETSFKLITKEGGLYSISNKDYEYKSVFIGQTSTFLFSINPKIENIQTENVLIDVDIIVKSKKDIKEDVKKRVKIFEEINLEYFFDEPGEYELIISSYLFDSDLKYTIKVFDGEYLIRPISGVGQHYGIGEELRFNLSLEVIGRRTKETVVNDFILWEIIERPLGAVVDFQRRVSTDQRGIASNNLITNAIKGKYIVRARRLFFPDEYYDFVFEVK